MKTSLEVERGRYQTELKKFSDKIKKLKHIQGLYMQEKANSERIEGQLNMKEKQLGAYKNKIKDVVGHLMSMHEALTKPESQGGA